MVVSAAICTARAGVILGASTRGWVKLVDGSGSDVFTPASAARRRPDKIEGRRMELEKNDEDEPLGFWGEELILSNVKITHGKRGSLIGLNTSID